MNGSAWFDIGAFAAAAAVLLSLIVHLVKYAYDKGKMDNRLETVEKAVNGHEDTKAAVAALSATVATLIEAVKELKAAVHDLAPRRVRSGA